MGSMNSSTRISPTVAGLCFVVSMVRLICSCGRRDRRLPSGGGGGFGMETEAERPNDFQDGGELRIPIAAQRLVERLPGQAGFLGELRHAASAGDHTQRIGDLARVAIRAGAVEIGEHL